MASSDKKPTFQAIWLPRLEAWGLNILRVFASRAFRRVIFGLSSVVVIWLFYANIWQPLQTEITSPPGIADTNPTLDGDLLQAINDGRIERLDHQSRPQPYRAYQEYFSQNATPTPTPPPFSQ